MDILTRIALKNIANKYQIRTAHIFADNSARDTYFASHESEKVLNTFISVGAGFQQWSGSAWLDKTAVLKGSEGADGVGITPYSPVAAASNVYPIDLDNKITCNIRITVADAVAKSVTVSNVPTECELLISLVYSNAAAITWFSGITWLNGIPVFTAGKKYKILLSTDNGGTTWQGMSVGGW